MTRRLKFSIGDNQRGYKSVELTIDGGRVSRKILRGGLSAVGKKIFPAEEISDEHLAKLDALEIFAWEKNYSSATRGVQWQLTFSDGDEIYRGRGDGAFPENFERLADWLDEFFPELEFVDRQRLERVTIDYIGERLTVDRRDKTLTLDKPKSNHVYDIDDDKKIFTAAQKLFDAVDIADAVEFSCACATFELVRHDGTVDAFAVPYTENFLPGLTKFLEAVRTFIDDLTADILAPPQSAEISARRGRLILCKVQFPGSYKHYTYSTDDETLSAGDIVDVPVGRNNDVTWARVVEIGYFDEYDTPIPRDKIKKIIGKHVADEWENV